MSLAGWTGGGADRRVNPRVAVTLLSFSLILSLTVYEFIDYRRVHMVRRLGLCRLRARRRRALQASCRRSACGARWGRWGRCADGG